MLPPAFSLLAALAAFLLWRRYPKIAKLLLVGGLLSLWLLALPVVSRFMLNSLESQYSPLSTSAAILEAEVEGAGAIVILGGGRVSAAREYGHDIVNSRTLTRLHFGARLYQRLQIPVLVTGGRVFDKEPVAEAQLMARVLRSELGVPVHWLEVNSHNTDENARFSAQILQEQGIDRVVLVTHAWHMPRAVWAFEQAGVEVVPAPMGFSSAGITPWLNWLPSAHALQSSHWALHEVLGLWVYQLSAR